MPTIDPGRFLQPYMFPITPPVAQLGPPLLNLRQRNLEMQQRKPLVQAQTRRLDMLNRQAQDAIQQHQTAMQLYNDIQSGKILGATQAFGAPQEAAPLLGRLLKAGFDIKPFQHKEVKPLTAKQKVEEEVWSGLETPEEKKAAVFPKGSKIKPEYTTGEALERILKIQGIMQKALTGGIDMNTILMAKFAGIDIPEAPTGQGDAIQKWGKKEIEYLQQFLPKNIRQEDPLGLR